MADGAPTWTDPEIDGVRALLKSFDPPEGAPEPTFEMRRTAMDAFGAMTPLPQGLTQEDADLDGLPAERLRPADAVEGRALLYLHGGGYCIGSPRSHRGMAARFADQTKATTLVPDYRLAPEAPFPAAVDDGLKAYRALLDEGYEPRHIAVSGDSAGGGLTLATMLAAREAGLPMPRCLFLISPWADLGHHGPSYGHMEPVDPMITLAGIKEYAAHYGAGADLNHPYISPARADLTGLPPMLIHVGQAEVLLSDSITLAQQAGMNGVSVHLEVWPEMIHVWHAFHDMLGAAREATAQASAWMAEQLG
ncbi:MAG TPA: alpha/beta hydrolase [Caulobacteraceae bacterium]